MKKLAREKRAAILGCLVEGNGIRPTSRLVGVNKATVLRLLADAATFCHDYHDLAVRGLPSTRVQVDEVWSFCGCKDKAKQQGASGLGSVWTWVAIDADSKLCIAYLVGPREASSAYAFIDDVASRLDSRVQLTSDGYRPYVEAVERAFGGEIDYARLIKQYDDDGPDRYRCIGCHTEHRVGEPDQDHVSTSYIERQNLTLRMGSRRFTRRTNGFSKRLENHAFAVALHYFYYNFIRVHATLRTTPAIAAGVASEPISLDDLVTMIEDEERRVGGRLTDYLPSK